MSTTYRAALLLLLLVAFPPAPTTAAKSRRASTSSFGRSSSWQNKLTLLGSATVVAGQTAVALTTNATQGIRAGRALLTEPMRLRLPQADHRVTSFYTEFRFRILPSPSYGDGLAFVLTSSPSFLGAADGFLGLYPSDDSKSADLSDAAYTIAVELDTHLDVALGDRDDNHVGIDTGSIFSTVSASPGVDLKSGKPISAWVEYRAPRRRLRAWFSYSSQRPRHPAIALVIDLSQLLESDVYVGFSASNYEGTAAVHIIESWTFHTFVSGPSSPTPPPTPVPASTPKDFTPIPVPTAGQHGLVKITVAVLSTVVPVAILAIFCIQWCRRRHRLKTTKYVEMSKI